MKAIRETMIKTGVRLANLRDGQGFVEYLMIIGLVGLGLSLALISFRNQISTALNTVGSGV